MSDNDIRIVIDGDEYTKFVSVSISESLDAVARGFSFSIARDEFDAKIRPNDIVEIYINSSLVLTGRVNKISNSYDSGSHDINISGFSQTFGLTKATLFFNPNYATPITFLNLARKIITQNELHDVGVTASTASEKDVVVTDNDENRVAGDIGETVFSFLDRYAKREGFILTDDEKGHLVIYENEPIASEIRIKIKKDQSDNKLIIAANFDIDYSERFKKIIIRSQDEQEELIEAFASDEAVQSEGVLTIISENLVDIAGCQKQANWEVNKRRTDSIIYNCKVFGFSINGNIWKKNTLVDVDDDFAGIRSQMIIKAVQFNYSDTEGSTTNISLTIPDAYSQEVRSASSYNAIFGDTNNFNILGRS